MMPLLLMVCMFTGLIGLLALAGVLMGGARDGRGTNKLGIWLVNSRSIERRT